MTIKITVKPPKEDKKALEALFNNLSLIIQNKNLILTTPEYYNIRISGVGVYPLYVQTLDLFIGDLLQLWEQTDWKQGDEYFYYITGSPLSGSNSCRIWHKDKGFSSKHNPSMMALLSPAFLLVQTGSPERTNNVVPVDLPKRAPSKLSIYDLINRLKS